MELFRNFLPLGVLFTVLAICTAQDTITADQAIQDNDTLVSANEIYELGFFSPRSSGNRYLGIWYKNISTVVWVANREVPITDSSGVFRVHTNGSLLVIAGSNNTTVWSSNTDLTSLTTRNPVAQLLSSGNLVVRERDQDSFIWESFDYPGDNLLPGMKCGKDLVSGRDRRWRTWKSLDDPSPGQYSAYLDTNGFPQLFVAQGLDPRLRYGPWNGVTMNGLPIRQNNAIITHEFVMNDKEVYYRYMVNSSFIVRLYFDPEGNAIVLNWVDRTKEWIQYWNSNIGLCSPYGLCGPYGRCNPNNLPTCSCMEGFEPQNPDEWSASQWSSGCRRRTALDCPNGDGFQVFRNITLPDTRRSWYNRSMTLDECAAACKSNCSCIAYANIETVNARSGCLIWSDDLIDVRTVDESHDLYVRMAVSDITIIQVPESTSKPSSNKSRHTIILVLTLSSIVITIILILATLYAWRKKKRSQVTTPDESVQVILKEYTESQEDDKELLSFSLNKISKATDDFADEKKLGEGGFGQVYKGVLEDGREIAVKRLSKTSRQGHVEFKNEVRFIAKLQHRNLVKLLGYCIQGDESMLVYEYMPNKSLDMFIFDKTRSSKLDWCDCFHIIHGIARGLLYLHQDSRIKIVHRDLKASNILLDADMNPKISDFGLARMFREHENEANTNTIVGTLGYISPEYAIDGIFSEKSDVFSFGVLVLEIVSGKKNRGFSHAKDGDNLLAHAWRLYNEGRALELLSSNINTQLEYQDQAVATWSSCKSDAISLLIKQNKSMRAFSKLVFFSVALFSLLSSYVAVDTITAGQALRDDDTIVSAGEMYELAFFSPGNSKNRYLGIWFKKISPRTVVWVANRATPLTSTTGVFTVNSNGMLLLLGGNNTMIWSSNSSVSVSNGNVVAKLLDSGNLVVCGDRCSSDQDFIWQSFDYPTDTLLAGMKLGKDLVRGIDWCLTSWKSLDDPSPGLYKLWLDTNGYPQVYQSRGSVLQLRYGPWNGVRFSGFPSKPNPIYTYGFVLNEKEVYTAFNLINSSIMSRLYLGPEGNEMRLNWIDPTQGWIPYLAATVDSCAQYGLCGAYGICNINTCRCMDGFEPRYPVQWNAGNWSGGCQREKPFICGNEEGFLKLSGVKLPDTHYSWYNLSMSLSECEYACKRNCSCTAYGNLDIRRGGSGCLLWFVDLVDVREYNEAQDVYIRIATSKLSDLESHFNRRVIEVAVSTMVGLVLVGLALGVYAWKKKRSAAQRQGNLVKALSEDYTGGGQKKDLELPFFSFSKLSNGYISPEYAVHGVFSVKSDVFSFGVLMLEIVIGMKNREFSSHEHSDNLLGHVSSLLLCICDH
ncbi:hypothetical protein L1987_36042 [Smallanthus sonchifolius]|uniref:Uncharacterized protein n=1 Tax=Smallanthus sonchifolius TaxID=185202 RepID=A0ACB9HDA2_9ASTR|nr:hypothetical protein L1987_36042 [Smallanthus sonchifolius]